MSWYGRILPTVVMLAGLAAPALAQGLRERLEFHGLIESATAIEVRDGDLQKWELIVKPELRVALPAGLRLTALGRIRLDPADRLEPDRPRRQRDARSAASRRLFLSKIGDVELREFYLDAVAGNVLLRIGKQQVVWGQADGLRVLDVVDPFDFREFILPAFEDRRIPLWTVNAEIPAGEWTVQILWIPDHTFDELPAPDATFAFTSPLVVPQPDFGRASGTAVLVRPAQRPRRFFRDDDYGIRASAFLGGWDLSFNYLYHYQDQAVPFREAVPGGIAIAPAYRRTHLIGGTFSSAFGDSTLRGEIGYSTGRFFLTRSRDDPDGVIRSGELGHVLGLDWQVDADFRLSGQIFQSILSRHPRGTIRDRVENRATLLVERDLLNDRLTARLLAIHSLNDGDGVIEGDVEYEYRSQIRFRFGFDLFYGARAGLFGEFRKASRITFGVEVGF